MTTLLAMPPPAPPVTADGQPLRYFVGLDLGQVQDFTALAVLQRRRVVANTPRWQRQPEYQARHLLRFHLNTPYPEIVTRVVALLNKPPLPGCMLVVDQTGVGRAVVDLLKKGMADKVTCSLRGVTITAGQVPNAAGDGGIRVPKKDLVGVLQTLLPTNRLLIAPGLPDAALLAKELENFRLKVTTAGNEIYEAWRDGQHDDLVLAVALAAWAGEQCLIHEGDPPPARQRLVVG